MAVRLTFEEVNRRMNQMHPTLELLDDFYVNAVTKMRIRCTVCGFEFSTTWQVLSGNHGCGRCSHVAKLTIEDIRKEFKILNPTGEILGDIYINVRTPLPCRCSVCGKEWKKSWNSIKLRPYCPSCHRKELNSKRIPKWTMDEIRKMLDLINPDIEILDDNYINAASPIRCRCRIDGNLWTSSWNRLQIKGCKICSFRNKKGDGNPNWNGGITPLQNHLRTAILPWKKDSRAASNYKCVITGNRFGAIHHLYGFDLILKETMELENLPFYENISEYTTQELERIECRCLELHYKYGLGICLTKKLHDAFHLAFGRGQNQPDQFETFLKMNDLSRCA